MAKKELSDQMKNEDYFAGVHPGPYIHDAEGCPKCEHRDPRKCFQLRYGFAKRVDDICDCGCHQIDVWVSAEFSPYLKKP